MVGSLHSVFEQNSRALSAPRASLSISTRSAGGTVTVVDMSGALTSKTLGTANDQLVRTIADGHHRIVVNLENLTSVTRAGARALLMAARFLIRQRGRMMLCNAREEVERTLRDTGFANLLRFHETEDDAVAAARGDGGLN